MINYLRCENFKFRSDLNFIKRIKNRFKNKINFQNYKYSFGNTKFLFFGK